LEYKVKIIGYCYSINYHSFLKLTDVSIFDSAFDSDSFNVLISYVILSKKHIICQEILELNSPEPESVSTNHPRIIGTYETNCWHVRRKWKETGGRRV